MDLTTSHMSILVVLFGPHVGLSHIEPDLNGNGVGNMFHILHNN
jgi:hypothetical protein